jgi:hypothetical protein
MGSCLWFVAAINIGFKVIVLCLWLVTWLLHFSMSLIFRLVIVFTIEFATVEFVVIIFDPDGNNCFGGFFVSHYMMVVLWMC